MLTIGAAVELEAADATPRSTARTLNVSAITPMPKALISERRQLIRFTVCVGFMG
jgi:hypothetical protein